MDRVRLVGPLVALSLCLLAGNASAQFLAPGFQRSRAVANLQVPTAVRFAPDGRVFVAEKRGTVLEYSNVLDTTPTTVVDLRTRTHNWADRGLLGLALDPDFPNRPYLYVAYSYDGGIGGNAPRWGVANADFDDCDPTHPLTDTGARESCPISGRISRIDLSTTPATETILVHDYFQQFSSHSIGTVLFGADGYLYAGGGDGASFGFTDYGQNGNQFFPDSGSPADEGGALRAQDIRTNSVPGDTVGLAGSIIRIDPNTGLAAPGNPLSNAAGASENMKRMLAYGMRNPFRFTMKPGGNEIWMGDVGADHWDEINVIADAATFPSAAPVNFGWPCYEGPVPHPGFNALDLPLCESLYAQGAQGHVTPFYTYRHVNENCAPTGSAPSGIMFQRGGAWPAPYAGALYFADYNRQSIYALPDLNADGVPDMPTQSGCATANEPSPYRFAEAFAVDLVSGPGADLFYVEIMEGAVDRIHFGPNRAPAARIALAAGHRWQGGARTVQLVADGADADGDAVTLAWDLDADGAFDDATGTTASVALGANEWRRVTVRASDPSGASDTASMRLRGGNTPPVPSIAQPVDPAPLFAAGDTIQLLGSASDAEEGIVPNANLQWRIDLAHCADEAFTDCHLHTQTTLIGGSRSFVAPSHAYPAYLNIRLTATDSAGASAFVERRIYPQVHTLQLRTVPEGLQLVAGETSATAPFDYRVIVNSPVTVIAPATQTVGQVTYEFVSWSDGGARAHEVIPDFAGSQVLTATYRIQGDELFADGFE